MQTRNTPYGGNMGHLFLSSLSHEIRTPLNGIVGYTQLLQRQSNLGHVQNTYVNSISSCALQLMEIINNILDFSKLCTGTPVLNKECFSITDLTCEIKNMVMYAIREKKQTFDFLFENIPSLIICDRQKLTQILINLIVNANKYTPVEGKILVVIEPDGENVLKFSVEDNGRGISDHAREKLFTPFYQEHPNDQIPNPVSQEKNGSGLGLCIVQKLVEAMGGTISVNSRLNVGSTFSVVIPYEPAEYHTATDEKILSRMKSQNILVIDDNTDNRLFLGGLIIDYGGIPVICSTAEEIYMMHKKTHNPALFGIVDICMPDVSGIDVAKKVKEIRDLPLIALTSVDIPLPPGLFTAILRKPVAKVRLLEVICRVLSECTETNGDNNMKIYDRNKKILVVEDVKYNLDMLVKMLASIGYWDIHTAESGEDAINGLRSEKYEIMLLDLKMPGMNGIQVLEKVQEEKIPLPYTIVITASVSEEDKQECFRYGAKEFLLKPFNMGILKNCLDSCF